MHNYSTCMQTVFFCYVLTVFFSQIRSLCCDRSGPFLQIRSHLYQNKGLNIYSCYTVITISVIHNPYNVDVVIIVSKCLHYYI